MNNFRSGFVALVGRPSAGKSTLLNALCGQKVSIISPKPQTTRNVIRGIVNRPAGQVVFLDTPGFTEAADLLATQLREELRSALRSAEVVLYLLDLSRLPNSTQPLQGEEVRQSGLGKEEQGLLNLVQQVLAQEPRPLCLALNKSDLLATGERQARIQSYLQELPELPYFEISAKKGEGLEPLLQYLCAQLPEGPPLYEEGIYTDQEPQFRIQELIREQALSFCGRELPYALYVEVADLEYRAREPEGQEQRDKELWVRAFLQVERESQKGILVGKGGSRIREIRTRSTRAVRREFACPVQLDLQVKVDYKWRRKRH